MEISCISRHSPAITWMLATLSGKGHDWCAACCSLILYFLERCVQKSVPHQLCPQHSLSSTVKHSYTESALQLSTNLTVGQHNLNTHKGRECLWLKASQSIFYWLTKDFFFLLSSSVPPFSSSFVFLFMPKWTLLSSWASTNACHSCVSSHRLA